METSLDLRGRRRRCDLLRACEVWGVATAGWREKRGSGVGTEGASGGEEVSIVRGWPFSVLAGHCCGGGRFRDDQINLEPIWAVEISGLDYIICPTQKLGLVVALPNLRNCDLVFTSVSTPGSLVFLRRVDKPEPEGKYPPSIAKRK
jgi:hypothetical protein